MKIKQTVTKQYREIVDRASNRVRGMSVPKEGWLRTTRKALEMPGKIIMKRAGIQKSELYRIEKAEVDGNLTLKKLKHMANSMGCELHYAIVPSEKVDILMMAKARKHAERLLKKVDVHMQLEVQGTDKLDIDHQIDTVAKQIIAEMPDWFWEVD